MDKQPEKILIILLGAIGDVTRALPLVVRIKNNWPDTEIVWAVEPISKGLVETHPAIDKVVVFKRGGGLPAYFSFLKELREDSYDLVLDLQRHMKSGFTSFASRGKRRIGFHRKNSRELNWLFNSESIPEMPHFFSKTLQFQKFGDKLGLREENELDFSLASTEDEIDRIRELMEAHSKGTVLPEREKRVALILGSTWKSRFWILEYYLKLIELLDQRWGFKAILLGSASEKEYAAEIVERSEIGVVNLVQQTKISDLKTIFSQVSFAIGSDSGPMHIAAGAGIPVISLWGSTSPKRSAPYGSEELVIEANVGCSPCYKKVCPGLNMICMRKIMPEDVVEKVEEMLGNGS